MNEFNIIVVYDFSVFISGLRLLRKKTNQETKPKIKQI